MAINKMWSLFTKYGFGKSPLSTGGYMVLQPRPFRELNNLLGSISLQNLLVTSEKLTKGNEIRVLQINGCPYVHLCDLLY